jgi:ABC-type uncharacterized transport system permease subunit
MEISRESWHYWVAAKWGGFESGDFCHYVRRFLLGVLALFLLSALGVLIGYALISGGFVLYKLVQTGHLLTPNGWWGLGFVIDIACLLVSASGSHIGVMVFAINVKKQLLRIFPNMVNILLLLNPVL